MREPDQVRVISITKEDTVRDKIDKMVSDANLDELAKDDVARAKWIESISLVGTEEAKRRGGVMSGNGALWFFGLVFAVLVYAITLVHMEHRQDKLLEQLKSTVEAKAAMQVVQ